MVSKKYETTLSKGIQYFLNKLDMNLVQWLFSLDKSRQKERGGTTVQERVFKREREIGGITILECNVNFRKKTFLLKENFENVTKKISLIQKLFHLQIFLLVFDFSLDLQ